MNMNYKQLGFSYLGNTNISAKLVKNIKVNQLTYSLYLAPHKLSGYNVCPKASEQCIKACLHQSGHNLIAYRCKSNRINEARIKKTKLLFENKNMFFSILLYEINKASLKAIRLNLGFSIRLNCTSDIDWYKIKYKGKNIFEYYPNIQFYDYTKIPAKFDHKPDNYYLTFSYSGENWLDCEKLLNLGYNIAIPFYRGLPESYMNYPVFDGDITDYRPSDPKNHIIGLRYKKTAMTKEEIMNNSFIIKNHEIL